MVDRGTTPPGPADEQSLLRILGRYWWLALLILIVAVGLAVLFDQGQDVAYEATAELIVEDPRASTLFDVTNLGRPSTQASERYLADQVEILRSAEIANVAETKLGGEYSARYILRNRNVVGDLTSNLIEVSFLAPTPEDAKAGADALAEAYQEQRRQNVQETAAVALAKVDALLISIDNEIADLDRRIAEAQAGDATTRELQRQFAAAQDELNQLRVERNQYEVGSEERAAINARIGELLTDFTTWEAVLRISERGSELDNLLAEKDAAAVEKATLVARANSIEVDAELASGGVALFSRAELPVDPTGISLQIILAAAIMLGLLAATVVAYSMSLRQSRQIDNSLAPRAILNAPLLAEVPMFEQSALSTKVPVRDAPTSPAAEAYRFAASMIDIRAATLRARSLLVVSAAAGVGRTSLVANAGLAAAAQGLRTLVVDADFAQQDLTKLLLKKAPERGISDVMDGQHDVKEVAEYVEVPGHQPLGVLSKGREALEAASYFGLEGTKALLGAIWRGFDLAFVDGPPILRVAYATTLARYVDGAIVVVEHGSSSADIKAVADHLSLIDVPILGYIYTKAAGRPMLAESEIRQYVEIDRPVPADRLLGRQPEPTRR